jgi:DNA (cytosine-5)-methyltransferase 1
MRSAEQISAVMRRVRSRDTSVEIDFRKALWKAGLRFRTHGAKLPGKPDIVLASKRAVIFIDGDFWHGRQFLTRGLSALEEQFESGRSRSYWVEKIRNNMDRDCRNTAALAALGWRVLRLWESDIRRNPDACVRVALEFAAGGPGAPAVVAERTVAEFFAGIGLMRVALERQGWAIHFANDHDPRKHEMYRGRFPEQDFSLADIHSLGAADIPSVTLATASFPCNDLSLAGARAGLGGKQSSAFWGFVEIIDALKDRKPPLILLENVPGFLTSNQGEDFRCALQALNGLGYLVDAFVVDAASFVPQSRRRLFVIAVERRFAAPRAAAVGPRPPALLRFIADHPEIEWSLRSIPSPPQCATQLCALLDHDAEPWEAGRAEYLLSQMSPRHRALADEMIRKRRWSYGAVFRRIRNGKSTAELRTDGMAGCLRTPRGGSARQILFKAGYGRYYARLLTPRECARLMGADDYPIETSSNDALFGFGDAVCVPVIEWIATYYLNPLICELLRACVATMGEAAQSRWRALSICILQ